MNVAHHHNMKSVARFCKSRIELQIRFTEKLVLSCLDGSGVISQTGCSNPVIAEEDMEKLNIESVVERACRDLQGVVPNSQVREVVVELAAKYRDAKVKGYLPIIIHRETVEQISANLKRPYQ